MGHERVRKSLRRQQLRPVYKRPYRVTTDSDHAKPIAANELDRRFDGWAVNRAWVADITYVATVEGWLYLAVVMDLASRRIVGWSMSDRIKAGLVCDALRSAYWRRKPAPGLIMHTDRGSQGEFNQSLQHVLTGGVDEAEEVEVGSIAEAQTAVAWQAAGAASRGALAVLEGDRSRTLQRGCSRDRRRVAGSRQSLVPAKWRYASIQSCAICPRAYGAVPFIRRA